LRKKSYIIGIDGGGSNTRCYLFNNDGYLIAKKYSDGSNLYLYKKKSIKRIINLIYEVTTQASLNISEISAFGFALAGVSDMNIRELFLKELDKLKISNISLILSDTEAAFNLLCPTGSGVLVSIGTGIMCLGRNKELSSFTVAGKGYKKDIGSGYWIGNQIINRIIMNQSIIDVDFELMQLFKIIKNEFKINNINDLSQIISNELDYIIKISSLAKPVIAIAQKGNDIALSVIHEATRNVADYILYLVEQLDMKNDELLIAGNGSVIKNNFYRKLLNQSMEFDFKKIRWVFSSISPALSAGVMAANYKNINISINNIVQNINEPS